MARLAGVSLGTVSHALNHPHRVAPQTLARVQRAIDELGFVPDRRARALAGGASAVIGFVVLDLTNSYFVDMARGAEDEASVAGMNVLLANADVRADKEQTYLQVFDEERVAGILLTPHARTAGPDDGSRHWRRELVVLNAEAGPDRCSVVPDDELGGYLATRHLIDSGRRRLVFAAALLHLAPIAQRLLGAQRAVAETDGVTLEVLTSHGLRAQHGHDIGEQILARGPQERPDGVFAAADLVALGIVQTTTGRADGTGLRVPEDLAVVGYDDNQAAWGCAVPLSTIAQPGHEIGRIAARLLIEEIRAPDDHEHQRVRLPPTLVVRASTAGAAASSVDPRHAV